MVPGLPIWRESAMSKTYRDWSPNQSYMFPPTPQDWLPEDDLVYFILDTVATLDLGSEWRSLHKSFES